MANGKRREREDKNQTDLESLGTELSVFVVEGRN
jgi:hypothetical protein